jgi:rubrerythrin
VVKNGSGSGAPPTTGDILRFAIAREEEAARLYDDLGRRAATADAKAMFGELRDDEARHKSLLERIVSGHGRIASLRPVPDLKISEHLVAEPLSPDSRFQEILIFAAKKEAGAAALYAALLDQADDPEHRRLFAFLVQQEKGHKLRLEQEYERHVLGED